MSRFSFYLAQAAFEATGLPGLTPKKPGPRGRHKLRPEVLTFVEEELAKDPSLERRDLPTRVQERFGLSVHLRSLERALAETKKTANAGPAQAGGDAGLSDRYEALRVSRTTSPEVVAEIDRLLQDHTYAEIAAILNERDCSSGQGKSFDGRRINTIRRAYGLNDRSTRLRAQGYLSAEEVAPKLGTTSRMVRVKRANGTLPVGYRKLSANGDCMYEDPDARKEPKTAPMSGRTVEV